MPGMTERHGGREGERERKIVRERGEGRREGGKEGRREGGKEGRREGGKEGRKEGWKGWKGQGQGREGEGAYNSILNDTLPDRIILLALM